MTHPNEMIRASHATYRRLKQSINTCDMDDFPPPSLPSQFWTDFRGMRHASAAACCVSPRRFRYARRASANVGRGGLAMESLRFGKGLPPRSASSDLFCVSTTKSVFIDQFQFGVGKRIFVASKHHPDQRSAHRSRCIRRADWGRSDRRADNTGRASRIGHLAIAFSGRGHLADDCLTTENKNPVPGTVVVSENVGRVERIQYRMFDRDAHISISLLKIVYQIRSFTLGQPVVTKSREVLLFGEQANNQLNLRLGGSIGAAPLVAGCYIQFIANIFRRSLDLNRSFALTEIITEIISVHPKPERITVSLDRGDGPDDIQRLLAVVAKFGKICGPIEHFTSPPLISGGVPASLNG